MPADADSFPLASFREAAKYMRRPFTAEALKWKFQTIWPKGQQGQEPPEPKGGLIVCYIDKGLVVDRLNLLVPDLWHDEYEDLGGNQMRCRLTVDGISREDVGEGQMLKARYSDSLKRAAVKFGIGVSLTRVPQSRFTTTPVDGRQLCTAWVRGRSAGLDLTQAGLDYLRSRYTTWLEQVGVEAFGDPLKHGDTGDAQGDEDDLVESGTAQPDEATSLLEQLLGGEFTRRQIRGLMSAAGVGNLPAVLADDNEVSRQVARLSTEQAERLQTLINNQRASGGADDSRADRD